MQLPYQVFQRLCHKSLQYRNRLTNKCTPQDDKTMKTHEAALTHITQLYFKYFTKIRVSVQPVIPVRISSFTIDDL